MEQTATLNPVPASKGSNAWLEALRTPLALGLAALLGVQLLAAIALSLGGRGSLVPAALDSLVAFLRSGGHHRDPYRGLGWEWGDPDPR